MAEEALSIRAASEISGTSREGHGSKISSFSLCCNMVLSITGSAVLGIGAQMKTFGWILTPTMLMFGVALTSEMVWLVSVTSTHMERSQGLEVVSYQDYAEAALGKAGWWASALSSTLSLVGIIIGGLVLESENLQIVAPIPWSWPLPGGEVDGGRKWWAVLVSGTTLLYSFVDIGSLLHKSGLIGVLLTIFCMICVYAGVFGQFPALESFNNACMDAADVPYRSVGVNTGGASGFQSFLSLFSVTSYMVFVFAIVVTLPTLRSTMKNKERLTSMSVLAFCIVAAEFLVIMLAYYWVFGSLGPQNVVDGMRHERDELLPGWWATVDPWKAGTPTWVARALAWGVTLHLLCSDAIYVPVTVVAIEALLPRRLASKRRVWVSLRIAIAAARLFFATVVTDFVKMTNLTSAAFVTMNNIILPILAFYRAGPSSSAGSFRRLLHCFLLAFGAVSMLFGTIGAIEDLVRASSAERAGAFPRPGISGECYKAYCELHPSDVSCAASQATS